MPAENLSQAFAWKSNYVDSMVVPGPFFGRGPPDDVWIVSLAELRSSAPALRTAAARLSTDPVQKARESRGKTRFVTA